VDKYDHRLIFPRLYAVLPRVGEPDVKLAPENQPVETKFLGDLAVLYGRDFPTHFEMIAQRELEHYGMTAQQLHKTAVHNLSTTDKDIRFLAADGGIYVVLCDGNLEASFLLHTQLWDVIQDQLNGDVVASVPARNVLLVSGTRPEQVAQLKQKTRLALEMEAKPLSLNLFLRVGDGWKIYEA
jgi:uncharacterized protein YtpQ (UPF0354 family)